MKASIFWAVVLGGQSVSSTSSCSQGFLESRRSEVSAHWQHGAMMTDCYVIQMWGVRVPVRREIIY